MSDQVSVSSFKVFYIMKSRVVSNRHNRSWYKRL